MANEKETTENEKVPLQTRVDPLLYIVISRLAIADGRSLSNATERLLLTHPIIGPMLEAYPAEAAAGATAN